MDLNKKEVSQELFNELVDEWFSENHPIIIAKFIEDNREKFNEFVVEQFEDHKGQKAEWKWKD